MLKTKVQNIFYLWRNEQKYEIFFTYIFAHFEMSDFVLAYFTVLYVSAYLHTFSCILVLFVNYKARRNIHHGINIKLFRNFSKYWGLLNNRTTAVFFVKKEHTRCFFIYVCNYTHIVLCHISWLELKRWCFAMVITYKTNITKISVLLYRCFLYNLMYCILYTACINSRFATLICIFVDFIQLNCVKQIFSENTKLLDNFMINIFICT